MCFYFGSKKTYKYLKGNKRIVLNCGSGTIYSVLEVVKANGLALEYVGVVLQAAREVVLESIKSDSYALKYADVSLRAYREFVIEAEKAGASILQ